MWGWTNIRHVVGKPAASSPRMWGSPSRGCECPDSREWEETRGARPLPRSPFFFCGVVLFFVVLRRPGLPLAPLTPAVHRSRATGFVLPVRGSAAFWWRWATPGGWRVPHTCDAAAHRRGGPGESTGRRRGCKGRARGPRPPSSPTGAGGRYRRRRGRAPHFYGGAGPALALRVPVAR